MAVTSIVSRQSRSIPLRKVVLADGIVVAGSGLLLATAAGPLADLFGLPAGFLRALGGGLIPYSGVLLYAALRTGLSRPAVGTFATVNLLWVAGSATLLIAEWSDLTALGMIFVVLQGMIVLGFAELQWLGLRQSGQPR